MRIGELSRTTGVPVPTIKYYLREGLLPAGERTSANQVGYGDEHAGRLRLIRAMVEVGGLPIGSVRDLLAHVDSQDQGTDPMLAQLDAALYRTRPSTAAAASDADYAAVVESLRRHGYGEAVERHLRPVADLVASLRALSGVDTDALLDTYADAALTIAEVDLDQLVATADRETTAETMIVGTVLGDALLSALRRTAHAVVSARVFGRDEPADVDA